MSEANGVAALSCRGCVHFHVLHQQAAVDLGGRVSQGVDLSREQLAQCRCNPPQVFNSLTPGPQGMQIGLHCDYPQVTPATPACGQYRPREGVMT